MISEGEHFLCLFNHLHIFWDKCIVKSFVHFLYEVSNSMSWIFSPVFSSKSFIILGLTSTSYKVRVQIRFLASIFLVISRVLLENKTCSFLFYQFADILLDSMFSDEKMTIIYFPLKVRWCFCLAAFEIFFSLPLVFRNLTMTYLDKD